MGINKDQVEGRVKEAKGTIKEVAGKLVGNESMEAKGKIQKNLGKVQAKFGDVKEDVKDATKPCDFGLQDSAQEACSPRAGRFLGMVDAMEPDNNT